jgi:YhgE/Pip-like protein
VWITVIAVTSVLIVLMTVIYIGSVVDPVGHLHGLPVLVVNEDAGATVGPRHVDVGSQVVSALEHTSAVSSRLSLDSVTMTEARERMDSNGAYATIVIPRNLTASTLALYGVTGSRAGPLPSLPTIRLLENLRAGSLGVSLATERGSIPRSAAISRAVGHTIAGTAPANPPATSPSVAALRVNPFTVGHVSYRPLPPHSALGLSAFYISLLAIMCGFLGASLINATVDGALGYATNEIGPKWQQRMPVRITRWQTLLAKWAMALVVPPILTALLLLVSIGLLGMDASHIVLLWVFLAFGAVVIAMGTLVLFAAFGNLGQLVAMLVFVYLALASSGGTIPLEALPGILRSSRPTSSPSARSSTAHGPSSTSMPQAARASPGGSSSPGWASSCGWCSVSPSPCGTTTGVSTACSPKSWTTCTGRPRPSPRAYGNLRGSVQTASLLRATEPTRHRVSRDFRTTSLTGGPRGLPCYRSPYRLISTSSTHALIEADTNPMRIAASTQ